MIRVRQPRKELLLADFRSCDGGSRRSEIDIRRANRKRQNWICFGLATEVVSGGSAGNAVAGCVLGAAGGASTPSGLKAGKKHHEEQ